MTRNTKVKNVMKKKKTTVISLQRYVDNHFFNMSTYIDYLFMQLKSLGEVDASPHVQLHKAGSNKSSCKPFQDVSIIFNQPVADRGRTTYRTPNRNTSRADDKSPPLEYPSSSTSPPQRSSLRSSECHSFPAWHQKSLPPSSSPSPTSNSYGRKRTRSRSLSDAPPQKHIKGQRDTGRRTSNQANTSQPNNPEQCSNSQPTTTKHHSNNATSTTTKWRSTPSAAHTQQQLTATQPTTLKPLRWLNDQVPTGRPKAHNYDHNICQILIKSCREFSATVCTQDALPNSETHIEWSHKIWEGACKQVEENYECTDRVVGLVSLQSASLF
jgi:hypothetical protein